MAIIGLIVLAVAVYGIIRAILHVLITIVEITAITAGASCPHRAGCHHRARHPLAARQAQARHGPKLITVDPATLPVTASARAWE